MCDCTDDVQVCDCTDDVQVCDCVLTMCRVRLCTDDVQVCDSVHSHTSAHSQYTVTHLHIVSIQSHICTSSVQSNSQQMHVPALVTTTV